MTQTNQIELTKPKGVKMKEIINSPHGLKGLPKKLEADVIDLCQIVFNGGFRHHHNNIRYQSDTDSISLARDYLKPKFRHGKGCYYVKVRDAYFDCIDENYSFGEGACYTKSYEMKQWVYEVIFEHYQSPEKAIFTQFDSKNRVQKPIPTIPLNAVNELDSEDQPSSTHFKLQPMIPIDPDKIEQLIWDFENHPQFDPKKKSRYRNLIKLYQIRYYLNNSLSPNSIMQLYRECQNGRLVPANVSDCPNIIPMSKELKASIFSDRQLYDYDIQNCHFSLFNNLVEAMGQECPSIKHYLENKSTERARLVEEYGIPIKTLKPHIISWIYGAHNNPVISNNIWKYVDYGTLKRLKEDELLNGVYRDIHNNWKPVVEQCRNSNGLITNILGKEQLRKDVDKKNKIGSELSFIMFGIESRIMEVINESIGYQNMLVLVYDGWIGNKIDVSAVEAEIKRKLGFDIKLDEKLIEAPPIEDLMELKNMRMIHNNKK